MSHPSQPSLPLSAPAVAALLTEIGQLMELSGDSPFKSRAYFTAAENLCSHPVPLEQLVAFAKLKTIPGVGEAIAEKIIKLYKTGTHPTLEYLRAQFPRGVLDLMKIPGLGPKKAATLHKSLNISNLNELEKACLEGRLAEEKGFGAKLQAKILESIAFEKRNQGLVKIDAGHQRAQAAVQKIKALHPSLKDVIAAADVRRGCEVCGPLDLVVVEDGNTRIESTPDCHVTVTSGAMAGAALLFATGSASHVAALCDRAKAKGLDLTPEGLRRGKTALPSASETEIYAALGLRYIEPELREGRGEIERANLSNPDSGPRPIEERDLRGILHCHTVSSDGSNTLGEMAEATRKLGMHYFGVCDHSQSAAYAGGMRIEKVHAQHTLADELNRDYEGKGFRIFKGVESDILEEGALDYTDEQLKSFDFIVASVHSRFQLDTKAQTARIVNAVRNPHTTILGHATGRLLLQREPYDVDLETVLKACADHGVAVEINADPHRLDLDWRWHRRALELGCLLAINPDAHDTRGLTNQKWGVLVARKGGVPADRVLNCLDLQGIEKHFEARRNAWK